ncbi:MAG: helix-turn-helix transcriptional regulator [Propionicimonas sp.]
MSVMIDATHTGLVAKALRIRSLPAPSMRRALRQNANLPMEDIAAELGVTRQTVSNWERGVRTPRGQHLERYLSVLNDLRRLEEAAA